jgi:polyvinyl alcohol dehydrogenase (cytochrome)
VLLCAKRSPASRETGSLQWARQMTEGDGWNFNCPNPNRFSCPEHEGPDLDFGSPPILRTVAPGKRLLLAGQKSGMLHAIDPDAQGKIVWQVRIGKGGTLGGVPGNVLLAFAPEH